MMQHSPGPGLSPAATVDGPRYKTKHTILSPTCHPPSMLDFEMDGQKKSICSEAYLLYAGVWRDCTGGKVSIRGDEVLRVLSASNMSDVSLYILNSASRVSFANPDGDYTHDEINGIAVSWRMFLVLLSLAHQLSGLDLDAFLRQFNTSSSQEVTDKSSANLPAEGPSYQSPTTRSPHPNSTVKQEDIVTKGSIKRKPLKDSPEQSGTASNVPLNAQSDPTDSIADGFQEYSNYFAITPQSVLPPSVPGQPGEECRTLPFHLKEPEKIPSSGPGEGGQLPRQDQAGFYDEKYPVHSGPSFSHNILSFDDGLIPVIPYSPDANKLSQQIPDHSGLQPVQRGSDPESAPIPVESSIRPYADPGLHMDPISTDPRAAPILAESLEQPELELVNSIPDSRSAPIPVHSLQQDASGLMLDDDWQSVETSTFEGYGVTKMSSTIFEAEVPDVTDQSRLVARNRLAALQNKQPSSKPSERKNLAIFGRKKTSTTAQYSLSILGIALEGAAREGSLSLVATFIEFGADPNFRSKMPEVRHQALQCAAAGGFSYIVDYLIYKGADSMAINDALIYAILRSNVDLAMKLISSHNADVNAFKNLPVKHKGTLSFSVGRVYANVLAVTAFINNKHDRIRLVRFLLGQRCRLHNIIWFFFKTIEKVEYGFGYSNLALFVPKCPDTVKILLAAGIPAQTIHREASPEVLDIFRRTGFSCNNLFIVQAISRIQGASWELRCSECLEMASQLIHNGADVGRAEFDGIEGQTGERGWKMTPLARAIKGGAISGVESLVQLGAAPNSIITFDDGTGHPKSRTVLHYAVQQGNIGVVQKLVSLGAAVNTPSNIYDLHTCQAPETALGRAASLGYLEIAKFLLTARADPNDGSLHRAARNGHFEVVKLLLQYGAEVGRVVDRVFWPTLEEKNRQLAKENPDVNRARRPRGNVLCFAMCWSGAQRQTTDEEKSNYLKTVHLILNAFDVQRLRIEQMVLRAALDANNIFGLVQLLDFPFTYRHPGIDMSLPMFYIWLQRSTMSRPTTTMSKIAYGFTPVQYAMMMRCDNSIIDLLMSKGASKIRVIYSSDEMDTLLAQGTSLIWETCRSTGTVPRRADGLEGAKEYFTHYRYGGEWRPVHIPKFKT